MAIRILRASLLSAHGPQGLWHEADGGLALDEGGRILAAGPFEALAKEHPDARIRDVRPCWILPGLVDLHTHLPQYGAVAMDGLELLPWLETFIYPSEARFADAHLAAQVSRIFFRDLLAWGTTTAVVYSSVHGPATDAAFVEADRAGLRVVLGKVMMDRQVPQDLREETGASLDLSEELCQRWHGHDHGRIQYAFSPRFAPACSPELMRKTGALAEKYGAFIQTHLAENRGELAWVRELFPAAENATEVYRHAGMLGRRTLLAHGIYLNPKERAEIREAGASLVHCPRSNAFLRSGILNLRGALDEGLRVGLGTDVGAGPSLSMWAEMAGACQASKLRSAVLDEGLPPFHPVEALRMATLGGAQALGLGDVIGSLEMGKDGDFQIVDPRFASPLQELDSSPEPPLQVLSRMMYRGDPRMVRETYVRGRACLVRED